MSSLVIVCGFISPEANTPISSALVTRLPFIDVIQSDADFVNVGARHWKGREEIEGQHAARLKQFIESIWTTQKVSVQFLTPDIARVQVTWTLKGDKVPDGSQREPRTGLFTCW